MRGYCREACREEGKLDGMWKVLLRLGSCGKAGRRGTLYVGTGTCVVLGCGVGGESSEEGRKSFRVRRLHAKAGV